MADKIDVDVTGKSKYEVAQMMAIQILFSVEGKDWKTMKRADYLNAVADSIEALSGIHKR